jgi:hypothetical protein
MPLKHYHPILVGWVLLMIITLLTGLGCSLGALMVQQPTPTPTRFKTPQPTFTFTPFWTPTFTPSLTPTPTSSPTPTETPTLTPTETVQGDETEEASAATSEAEAPAQAAAPAEPANNPPPEQPAATSTPAYPFNVVFTTHDTGSPGETRITGWIRIDYEPGRFKTLENFQMKATAPDGNIHLSELSGPGTSDSTAPGTGDNHPMNTKLEIRPYTSGTYRLSLVENQDIQVSPEIEFTLSADPLQYIHFDFFRLE